MKEKAIEICKNLTKTINTMSDTSTGYTKSIEANSIFVSTKAKKSTLIRQRKNLMEKYDLTLKDVT